MEAGGEKNPSFAQAHQHVSSGWKVRPKCLPKRKRGSSIVSMADKGAGARIAGQRRLSAWQTEEHVQGLRGQQQVKKQDDDGDRLLWN